METKKNSPVASAQCVDKINLTGFTGDVVGVPTRHRQRLKLTFTISVLVVGSVFEMVFFAYAHDKRTVTLKDRDTVDLISVRLKCESECRMRVNNSGNCGLVSDGSRFTFLASL